MLQHASRKCTSIAVPLSTIFQAAFYQACSHRKPAHRGTSVSGARTTSALSALKFDGNSRQGRASESGRTVSEPSSVSDLHLKITGDESCVVAELESSLSGPLSVAVTDEAPENTRRQSAPSTSDQTADLRDVFVHAPGAFISSGYRRSPSRSKKARLVTELNADSLSNYDMDFIDPSCTPFLYEDEMERDALAEVALVSYGPYATLTPPALPFPTSRLALHQHLLFALQGTPPLSLRRLVAYHDTHWSLHSTRSYNLLISISLRQASFGTVEYLMTKMRQEGVRANLETRKLWVRWMVRTGHWQKAWKEVVDDAEEIHMPLPVWLEFFGTVHKAALRTNDGQGNFIVQDIRPSSEDDTLRFRTLMENSPKLDLTPKEAMRVPTRALQTMVHTLLRANQHESALQITRAYLKALPRKVNDRQRRACLDIIHQYLHYGSRKRSVLHAHHAQRKLVLSLLNMRPDLGLRANSTTVFLLLRDLHKTTKCGTIAENMVLAFQRKWGPAIVDRRVRRRVAFLALKEGRQDIVDRMLHSEASADIARKLWQAQKEVLGGTEGVRHRSKRLLRQTSKKIWIRRSREGTRWLLLRRRVAELTRRRKKGRLKEIFPEADFDIH